MTLGTLSTGTFMYQAQIIAALLAIPRIYKRMIALLVEAWLCVITVWLGYCLRLDGWVSLHERDMLPVIVSLLLALPVFISFGLYRPIFRYAGVAAFVAILRDRKRTRLNSSHLKLSRLPSSA